jgi:hypothetical protein
LAKPAKQIAEAWNLINMPNPKIVQIVQIVESEEVKKV